MVSLGRDILCDPLDSRFVLVAISARSVERGGRGVDEELLDWPNTQVESSYTRV
jgi:hypothetical protein